MGYKDKAVQLAYQNERSKRLRNEWCKANGPCKRCGSWDNLEVDHVNPAEKVSHVIWSWSEDRRLKELEKCQVLCNACHKKKTAEDKQRQHPLVHGTLAGYKSRIYHCRCVDCKKANAEWKAANQRKHVMSGSGQAGKAPDLGSGNSQVRTLSPRPIF